MTGAARLAETAGEAAAAREAADAMGRGLHSLISELNLRTFGNTSLTLELNLRTFGTHRSR